MVALETLAVLVPPQPAQGRCIWKLSVVAVARKGAQQRRSAAAVVVAALMPWAAARRPTQALQEAARQALQPTPITLVTAVAVAVLLRQVPPEHLGTVPLVVVVVVAHQPMEQTTRELAVAVYKVVPVVVPVAAVQLLPVQAE